MQKIDYRQKRAYHTNESYTLRELKTEDIFQLAYIRVRSQTERAYKY